MNGSRQQANKRQSFGRYLEPIEVEGKTAELYSLTETIINDVDKNEVVIDRKKEPLFGIVKSELITGMTENIEKFKAEHTVALEVMMSQLEAVNNL